MLVTKYPLDSIINEFLIQTVSPFVYKQYMDIFIIVNSLNMIEQNNNILDLSTIEAEILDIIFGDDEETDNKIDRVEVFFKNTILRYINKYGIYLINTISLSNINSVLTALFVILTIDKDFIPEIINYLNNTENGNEEEIVANILAEYSDLYPTELLEMIDDVSESSIGIITSIINKQLIDTTPELTEDIIVLLSILSNTATEFNNTYIINNIKTNGYVPFTIDKVITELYNNVEKYLNCLHETECNITMVAYEIVGTFFLADDTRNDLINMIHDKFIYENVSYLHNDIKTTNFLRTLVETTATAIKQ